MNELFEKLIATHDALTAAHFPHAFGGAIALAYCTKEPRGTRDLDLNVFVPADRAEAVLGTLPKNVVVTEADIKTVMRDAQARLWWDVTPIDIFLNNHPIHEQVARNLRWVPLGDREIPVLDCASLIVFKALFNRTKDWADIEAIAASSKTELRGGLEFLSSVLTEDDEILQRLVSVAEEGLEPPTRGL